MPDYEDATKLQPFTLCASRLTVRNLALIALLLDRNVKIIARCIIRQSVQAGMPMKIGNKLNVTVQLLENYQRFAPAKENPAARGDTEKSESH